MINLQNNVINNNTLFSISKNNQILPTGDNQKTVDEKVAKLLTGENKKAFLDFAPEFKKNRFLLNESFKDTVFLKNRLFYCYYPTLSPFGHSHFDIENSKIRACSGRIKEKPKQEKTENNSKSYHFSHRIELLVTPRELNQINTSLDQFIRPTTCAHSTSLIIGYNTHLKIPFPIAVSPLLSRIYLQYQKISGWERIGNIENRGASKFFNGVQLVVGPLLETCLIIAIGIVIVKGALPKISKLFG